MSVQMSEKKPLDYSNNCQEVVPVTKDEQEIDSHTEMHVCNEPLEKTETKHGENFHINNTSARILIISRDCREKDSTDTCGVVPIFSDQESGTHINTCSPCLTACSQLRSASAGRDCRSMSLPGGIKSVLKTGRNDAPSHMLANRPIKTVTFVDYVTVVTVF